jgi:hypothetical protein
MKRTVLIGLAAAFAALTLSACMEVEQTVTAEQRQAGSTVKRDTAAWNNEPLANGPKWNKGDRNSWEEQIKKRQLAQNESVRIGN